MSTLNKLEIFNRNLDDKKRRETFRTNARIIEGCETAKLQAEATLIHRNMIRKANDNT